MMTKAPKKKQGFAAWKLQKMTEFGQQVQLLKLDAYSASVWRTIHGDMHAKGKKMSYAELAAKSGMSERKAKQIVKKLESLGFLAEAVEQLAQVVGRGVHSARGTLRFQSDSCDITR